MKVLRHTTADQLRQGDVFEVRRAAKPRRYNVLRTEASRVQSFVYVTIQDDRGVRGITLANHEPVTIWEAE